MAWKDPSTQDTTMAIMAPPLCQAPPTQLQPRPQPLQLLLCPVQHQNLNRLQTNRLDNDRGGSGLSDKRRGFVPGKIAIGCDSIIIIINLILFWNILLRLLLPIYCYLVEVDRVIIYTHSTMICTGLFIVCHVTRHVMGMWLDQKGRLIFLSYILLYRCLFFSWDFYQKYSFTSFVLFSENCQCRWRYVITFLFTLISSQIIHVILYLLFIYIIFNIYYLLRSYHFYL